MFKKDKWTPQKKPNFQPPHTHTTPFPQKQKLRSSNARLTINKKQFIEYTLNIHSTVDLDYCRVTIPRPAGIELVDKPVLGKGLVAFEERNDAFHFFIEKWARGNHSIKLHLRADLVGTVFAPQPQLAPMYGNALKVMVSAPHTWLIKK